MKKNKFIIVFTILTLLASVFSSVVLAVDNNKFGIHILEPQDLKRAKELVNSSGGDWGWVTIVIQDNDMNHDKWQDFMDECRISHLLPVVRIATHFEGNNWAKPKIDDINNWVNFLDGLNWPSKDQWIIIFNEPNHAGEWGGEVNPKEYGNILDEFISKLKSKNPNFKILNAGLDLAAGNSKTTMESFLFMKKVAEEYPLVFDKLDAWATHSYPNHGYLGKPWEYSRHSIKGYEWELNYLKNSLNLKKDLPVFITETGWPKSITEYVIRNKKQIKLPQKYYDEQTSAEYLKYAFENIWLKDNKVIAVTPFVLNYPGELFFPFAWIDKEGKPYPVFEQIINLPKVKARPEQETAGKVVAMVAPYFLPVETEHRSKITLKNTGQSIWGDYSSLVFPSFSSEKLSVSDLILNEGVKVVPGEKITFDFTLRSSTSSGIFVFGWEGLDVSQIEVLPSSIITNTRYNLWEKLILKIKTFFI